MGQFDSVVRNLKREIEKRFGDDPLASHALSVAELSGRIAEAHDGSTLTAEKIYVAGLAHDLYKKHDEKSLRTLIQAEAVPIDEHSWKIGGGLLHAPVAAHYLRTRLRIRESDILAAVYYHTTSRAQASVMEKILFCVDYLDPTRSARPEEPDLSHLRAQLQVSLEEVYREVLSRKISYTLAKGRALHPDGIAAWNETCIMQKTSSSGLLQK